MAQRPITIFKDTVLKLSINQGLEVQRTEETLGTFTMGELAFTRDTGRVFVGDNSDGLNNHQGYQETIGGTLVGNKYLGLIDSKPLTVFNNNGKPLSLEEATRRTNTQEYPTFTEQPLLLSASKFRDKSPKGAEEEWSRWSRVSTYNEKYNAYNGDYMFDIYRNALILFDNRISAVADSPTQPQIKKSNGVPVSPETFIVDGKEYASSSDTSVALTRRTTLQNYSVESAQADKTDVYGDGYVIMRIVEPDNKTIRFKKREFALNGIPTDGANISHNVLEVFDVPIEAVKNLFSNDFTVSDKVYLHKDIQNVKSITAADETRGLKLPQTLVFAKKYITSTGTVNRGAVGVLAWTMQVPTNINQKASYKVIAKPNGSIADNTNTSASYQRFNIVLEEDVVPIQDYYIKLEGGLQSNQVDPDYLCIDEKASIKNPNVNPVLILPRPKYTPNVEDLCDPYDVYTENNYPLVPDLGYSNNFGITEDGYVAFIDTYSPAYKQLAKPYIDKWEEENPSINAIRKPITIVASSDDKTLYPETTAATTQDLRSQLTSLSSYTKRTNSYLRFNTLNLLESFTGKNQWLIAGNLTEVAPTDNITFNTSYAATIPKNGMYGGTCFAVSLNHTLQTHMRSVTMKATLSGIGTLSTTKMTTCKLLLALMNSSGVVTYAHTIVPYSTSQMTVTLDIDDDVTSDCYLVAGFMGDTDDNMNASYTLTINQLSYTYTRYTDDDEIIHSKCGVNALLDFVVTPYVFCTRKIISSPFTRFLPALTDVNNFPNKPSTTYFNSFTNNHIKTWNNLLTVMGHNHYANITKANTAGSNYFFLDGYDGDATKAASYSGKAFLDIANIEYGSNFQRVNNSGITEEDAANKAIFSWASITTGSTTEYVVDDQYDTRSDEEKATFGQAVNFIYLVSNGTNTNIMTSTSNVIVGTAQSVGTSGAKVQGRYLMPEHPNLANKCYKIVFGNTTKGWQLEYDLIQNGAINYDTDLDFAKVGSTWQYQGLVCTRIRFITGTSVTATYSGTTMNTLLTNGLRPWTALSNGSRADSCSLVEMQVTDEDGLSVLAYVSFADVQYLLGMDDPGTLSGVKIKESNYAAVTVDESVADADQIRLPNHAKSILLEMTHVTNSNNTVGVFWSNEFENLGVTIPGLQTLEYNTSGVEQANGFMSSGTFSPLSSSGYVASGSVYKQRVPSTRTDYSFHDLSQSISNNTNKRPSIYWTNTNEKALCVSNKTERRVLEVPIQQSNYSGYRHFSLRLANIRPTTTLSNEYFSLRVVGYTV